MRAVGTGFSGSPLGIPNTVRRFPTPATGHFNEFVRIEPYVVSRLFTPIMNMKPGSIGAAPAAAAPRDHFPAPNQAHLVSTRPQRRLTGGTESLSSLAAARKRSGSDEWFHFFSLLFAYPFQATAGR